LDCSIFFEFSEMPKTDILVQIYITF